MKTFFTVLAALFILNVTAVFGQIGGLDTSFGQGGKVTTLVTFTCGANAIALQNDGKIVAAGYGFNGTKYEFAVARYNTDGSLDTTFGTGGIDTTRIRNGNSVATGVAIEPNGKIILAGWASNVNFAHKADTSTKFAIVRYTSSGLLDTTFANKGVDTFYVGNSDTDDVVNALTIQPDGKILLGGFSGFAKGAYADFAMARIDTSGVLDTSFNKTGKVLTGIGSLNDIAYTLTLQKDNKILLGGSTSNSGNLDFALARYLPNGILDVSFNIIGFARVDFGNPADVCYSIALQSDAKIILGGNTATAKKSSFALVRLKPNGIVDSSFKSISQKPDSTGRIVTSIYGNTDAIKSLAIDSVGNILAAGYTYNTVSKVYNFALIRYDSLGIIDTTFGDSLGRAITTFGTANAQANAMVIQHDDKILLTGYALNNPKQQFALARFNIHRDTVVIGGVDFIAENNSLFIYPNPVQDEATLKYSLLKQETVTIKIFNITGRLVQTIISNENKAAGSYIESLDLQLLPAGVYIVNLSNSTAKNISVKIVKQ